MTALQQASHKLAEELYKDAQAQQAQGEPAPEGEAGQPARRRRFGASRCGL